METKQVKIKNPRAPHTLYCGLTELEDGTWEETHCHNHSGDYVFPMKVPLSWKEWHYGDEVEIEGEKYIFLGTNYEQLVVRHV